MELLTITDASKLSGVPDSTLRDKVAEGVLNKYENDAGKMCVDKRELLHIIPTVITVFNQKGGCSKSSISVLLADYYEKLGVNVLIVDFDQQGNLSQTFFTYEDLKNSLSLYHYFDKKTPLSKIVKSYSDYIDILPADLKLADKDVFGIEDLDTMKKDFLPLFKKYPLIIIDCPPAINSFSKFGLLLSNYVLIPVIPEPYNYDGLFEALNTIKRLKKYIEGYIDFRVIISAHEQRTIRIHEDYINLIRDQIKEKVLQNTIPNFVGIKERAFQRNNIFSTYKNDKSLKKIEEVLKEIDKYIYDER